MPSGNARSSKPKPAEVAAETKRKYLPIFREGAEHEWAFSYLVADPFGFQLPQPAVAGLRFEVQHGDPVDWAAWYTRTTGIPCAFICAANDKRAGGDWDTGVVGYEERLCRRSSLSVTLSNNANGFGSNFPLTGCKGIYSPRVVVFRGPHDRYEKLDESEWSSVPVCSMTPTKWPKLTKGGTQYSFAEERAVVKDKLLAALRICAFYEHTYVVIGDFGLGNSFRNPPREMAEMWREILCCDPDMRGRFAQISFVFEDPHQSTHASIEEHLAKSARSHAHSSSASNSKGKSKASSHDASSARTGPSDFDIFRQVFCDEEITRILANPDPRLNVSNLIS